MYYFTIDHPALQDFFGEIGFRGGFSKKMLYKPALILYNIVKLFELEYFLWL